MKNFFKKLSFVLAIAMVLTSIAPATASAKEVVPAKKVNVKLDGEKVTSVELDVEETKTVKVGLVVKKAYAGQKSTYKTWYTVADENVVDVVREGNKTYTLTGVEAGETTITINAAKTLKLAKAGKGVERTIDVVVNAPAVELTAKQTGVKKITVTGSNLTDTVADYVVKRGTVTLSLAEVKLNDEKTEAVLSAASSTIPAGDYTLTVGETTVEFTVEAEYVDEIVIDPEVAILDGNSAQYAWTHYTVYNQFDEDITKAQYNAGNLMVTGGDVLATDPHWVKFDAGAGNNYTMNVSPVSLAVVCTKNGENTSKILTVSEASKLSEVTFKGLYAPSLADPSVLVETAMDVNSTVANYQMIFAGKDQYGFVWPNARIKTEAVDKNINVNLSSVTGLTSKDYTALVNNELGDYGTYIGVTLKGNIYSAGEVSVLSVLLKSGTTVSDAFTVAEDVMVDSLTISADNGVYGGQWNKLNYVALDQNGNEITDYATLAPLNSELTGGNGTLFFNVAADGSADLYYAAPSTSYALTQVLTVLTETNKFTTTSITVQPNRVPTAIIGIDANVAVGATSSGVLDIAPADFIVQDQYGNTMNWLWDNAYGRKLAVTVVDGNDDTVFDGVSTKAGIDVNSDTAIIAGTATATKGAVTVTVNLEALNTETGLYEAVAASDYTFKLYNVNVANVTNFAIEDIDTQYVTGEAVAAPVAKVYGFYAGKKIDLNAGLDYTLLSGDTIVPALVYETTATGLNYYAVKEGTIKVVINNAAGTEVTKTYGISGIPAYAATAYANPYYGGNVVVASSSALVANGGIEVSATHIVPGTYTGSIWVHEDGDSVMFIADQYNKNFTGNVRYTVTGDDVVIVSGNNTADAKIAFYTTGYHTINVKYTWDNGYTYDATVVVLVQ